MKRAALLHPFLFALWPVAFLYGHNVDQVSPRETLGAALVCLAGAALAWAVFGVLSRSVEKGAALASLTLLLFFSYGHLGNLLEKVPRLAQFGDRGALAVWAAALALVLALAARRRPPLPGLTRFLAGTGLVLLVVPLAGALPLALRARPAHDRPPAGQAPPAAPERRPDIYYIILDSYAREDILRQNYFFDNSGFVAALRNRGFFVADESRSNYSQTLLSLSSSLNGVYLDTLAARLGPQAADKRPLREMIARNWVVETLRERGYAYVTFLAGWSGTGTVRGDVDLRPPRSLTEFQTILLEGTPLGAVAGWVGQPSPDELHRQRLLFILGELPKVARDPRPTFTFAHVLSPHTPFVLGTERKDAGVPYTVPDPTKVPTGKRRYVRQVNDLNARVLAMVDELLAASPEPPVIVIQADHGPKWSAQRGATQARETLGILNAYHVPGGGEGLYPGITPVNTFRLLFNRLLGGRYDLLPDRSYYSGYARPYAFRELTDKGLGPAAGEQPAPPPGTSPPAR